MTYRWIENIPAEQLDAFVESCGNGSVLQESRWAKVKENWESYFVGVSDGKQIVATAMILSRTLVRPFTLFYIPRGPIMDFENHELVEFFFAALKKFAKKKHAVYVKFDPLIVHSVHQPGDEVEVKEDDPLTAYLKSIGMKHHGYTLDFDSTFQPRTQAVVYLNEDKPMNKKLRYYLNNAKNRHVEIVRMKEEGVDLFAELEHKTEQRKNISLRNADYFRRLMQIYGDEADLSFAKLNVETSLQREEQLKADLEKQLEDPKYSKKKRFEIEERLASVNKYIDNLQSFQKEYGNEIWISGGLIIRSGRFSELLYAGMDENFRSYRSNSSFQDALDWAKENGCEKCNTGGVEGTLDDSLTVFKQLYSPHFESYIGEFDMPVNTALYGIINTVLPFAKKARFAIAARRKQKE